MYPSEEKAKLCVAESFDWETPANLRQTGASGAETLTGWEEWRGFGEGWNDSMVIFSTCALWVITVISALGSNPMT